MAKARRGAGAVERGGLENRCPPCGGPRVRIPPSPPPKYLILLIYVSPRLSQKSPRLSAPLRAPRGRCGRQRRISDRRCVANPTIISVRDCCSTVWESVGGEVVGAGL